MSPRATLTVAVTGMSAGDNPAPGVPVIRALRQGAGSRSLQVVGLSYDPLDPGNYLAGIADSVFLTPYPSQGSEVMLETITTIHQQQLIDVLLPTLDAELPVLLKLSDRLTELGIRTLLPRPESLELRSKARLGELQSSLGISVPRSVTINDCREIAGLEQELGFPMMIKGQFYEAYSAASAQEAEGIFGRLRQRWGLPVVAQEMVAGNEYDVAAVGDGQGGLIGSVPMRKLQLTDRGKAWGGVTVADPELSAFVADVIRKLRWRGPCELEVIRSSDTGAFSLIEINPRFPAWIYLAVGAERNLPWATVRLALGEQVQPLPPPAAGVMFLRHSRDEICFLDDYQALTTRGELHHDRDDEKHDHFDHGATAGLVAADVPRQRQWTTGGCS